MSKLSEKIRGVEDGSAEEYPIPEWGVTVEIRSMTARARAQFVSEVASDDGTISGINDPGRIEAMWWHVISQTVFDTETNELAFGEGDDEWLFEKNARVINDLATACMSASGLTEESAGDAGKGSSVSQIDEADETPNDASTSD